MSFTSVCGVGMSDVYYVQKSESCDEVANQSDHCPIVLSLNIDVSQTIHSPTVHRSRKQWNRASESDKTIYIEMY